MSDTLITIKTKSKTGQIVTMQVLEILEIDGKPYQSAEMNENLHNHVIHLDGRVCAIEAILNRGVENG